jgi:minor extracellular serine protease Vpr
VFAANRYAVFLTEPPVGVRYTTRESLQTAGARGYRQQVERAQAGVMRELASRNVRVVGSVATLLNAIFVVAPPESLAELKTIPGVAGVMPMRTGHRNLNVATQLMNAAPGATTSAYPSAWSVAPGGSANAGAGIKIGILDTGIDQTHPAFQDSSLTMPAGFPICNTDSSWSCSAFTNNKVIVARSYVRQISAYGVTDPMPLPGTLTPPAPATSAPDDYSPRDRDGHGTAVASSVAAVYPTAGVTVPINGMAPKAYLGNYKIYGSPGVNDYPPEDVWIQAIDDALSDGMNIVNFSSGFPATTGALDTGAACGNAAGVACDPVATAFESAVQHGLTIVVAAGNSGVNYSAYNVYPMYGSVSSPATAPSVITVGATLNGHAFGPSVSVPGGPAGLQNIASVPSDSYVVNLGGLTAPLVDVGFVGDGYACSALPANSLANSFALVERGPTASPCAFSTKAANVEAAGAIGLILYQAPDSPASWNTLDTTGNYNFIETVDQFYGPVVGISNPTGVQLKNYIDTTAIVSYMANGSVDPWPLVTIDVSGAVRAPDPSCTTGPTGTVSCAPGIVDSLATYSSIGPSLGYFGACGGTCTPLLLKPEMVAIGGGDYNLYPDPNHGALLGFSGLYVAAENFDPSGEVYSSTRYAAANGTSFSSPLTAGAAALVKQAHPAYTPAQIKSALVNWSNASAVPTDDFGSTVDVRQTGAGLLDAGAAAQATITATPSTISFGAVKTGGALPAAQQITIANLGSSAVTLTVAVVQQASASGAPVTVNPSSLSLGASGSGTASATITVSVTGSLPAVGAYYGRVNLTGSGVSMHIPYLLQVGNNLLGSGSTITGNVVPIFGTSFGGIAGADMGPIALQVVDAGGLPIVGASVTFSSTGGLTMRSVSGEPACTGTALAVVCNTDNYGIAYTDVLLGATAAQETIVAGVTGLSATDISMTVIIEQQPTIAATGVRDAAQAKTSIAPGSYVSIYGSALSDYTGGETTAKLPLSLNGVTVSFDAPSANISVPGQLLYTSPTQVNVQVPWELQGLNSSVQMKVTLYEYEYGNVVTVPVADTAPAFFETTPGNVAALIAGTYTYVTPSSPVTRGTPVVLYANGLGPVNNQPASGNPAPSTKTANTKNTATMTIGGQSAPITYCGLVPGYPGLYEVDATVPATISTTGAETVSLTIAGQTATSSITVK